MPATIISCALDALPIAAATADSRLRLQAANRAFVDRWTALGGDTQVLSGGLLPLLCPSEERLQLQRALWRQRARAAQKFSMTVTAPRVVLDLTPLESTERACWLVTLRDPVAVQEPSSNRMAIAALAHDLKMPVQAVLGWVSLLRRKPVDAARLDEVLKILERNALLEAEMLNELLEVARSPGGARRRRASRVNIGELLRSTIEALRPLAEEAGIQLTLRGAGTYAVVSGNAQDLARIVGNLLANAIKFSNTGGNVECEMSVDAGWVRLVVRDQGRGISAGFLPHVFDSFRREGRSEIGAPEGLGIGLTAVRHLVQRHGGSVRAESEGRGRGATFTVKLPRADARTDTVASVVSLGVGMQVTRPTAG